MSSTPACLIYHRENCLQLLQTNGLKYLFPFLMGRGIPSGVDKGRIDTPSSSSSSSCSLVQSHLYCYVVGKREVEEFVISIISQLCLQVDLSLSPSLLSLLISFSFIMKMNFLPFQEFLIN